MAMAKRRIKLPYIVVITETEHILSIRRNYVQTDISAVALTTLCITSFCVVGFYGFGLTHDWWIVSGIHIDSAPVD